jgi:hypothetical protein
MTINHAICSSFNDKKIFLQQFRQVPKDYQNYLIEMYSQKKILQLEIKNKVIHTMIQKITLHINNYFPKN